MSTLSLTAPCPARASRHLLSGSCLPETVPAPRAGRCRTSLSSPAVLLPERPHATHERSGSNPAEEAAREACLSSSGADVTSRLFAGQADKTFAAFLAQRAQYGPRSAPLFYTALREAPARLRWEAWPDANAYRVTIGLPTSENTITPLMTATTLPGEECSLAVTELALRPGQVYAWRVEPILRPDCRVAEALMGDEGRFWLTDPDLLERWERGRALFEPMADPDFRAIAQALLLAEVGLFHEALRSIRSRPNLQEHQGRAVLAHTAQALIYKQMGQRLAEEERAPADFRTWATARETYHRQRVSGQIHPESETMPQAPRAAAPARKQDDRQTAVLSRRAA